MTGEVIGLARRARPRAPMETLEAAQISQTSGLEGDARGVSRMRQVTILFVEDWQAAAAQTDPAAPWITRRANVLVAGLVNPRAAGGLIQIGDARIRILGETEPCSRMDAAVPGLRAALTPDWRGGVFGRVEQGGRVAVGDPAQWLA